MPESLSLYLQPLLGIAVFVLCAWTLSERRRAVPWRPVGAGIVLQGVFAVILLKLPYFQGLFITLNQVLLSLEEATQSGTSFVFGYLGGAPLPYETSTSGSSFILAFRAFPLILVVSALSSLLFYWRILPWVVRAISYLLEKSMGIGGALGLGAAANIFVGMVEAPLFIRPYIREMGHAELFALMTCGMATIAGTVMVLYASILAEVLPDAMGHILTASLISAPAALVVASIMVPPEGRGTAGALLPPQQARGAMDAVTKGTLQGVELLINVIAMLLVLVALVSLLNMILGLLPDIAGQSLTLQHILGLLMTPIVWLLGIPWEQSMTAGALMGTKTVLNELLAYLDFARLPGEALDARSRIIMTYALCGFANFGSLGIMIGGLGTMVPERRAEIVSLGMKSIIAGTIATLMTGAVVGLVI
jgi:CNT family concentrative nucleoside transporter